MTACFARWCPPCQNVSASLKERYKTYADRGIQIVGLAVNSMQVDDSASC